MFPIVKDVETMTNLLIKFRCKCKNKKKKHIQFKYIIKVN